MLGKWDKEEKVLNRVEHKWSVSKVDLAKAVHGEPFGHSSFVQGYYRVAWSLSLSLQDDGYLHISIWACQSRQVILARRTYSLMDGNGKQLTVVSTKTNEFHPGKYEMCYHTALMLYRQLLHTEADQFNIHVEIELMQGKSYTPLNGSSVPDGPWREMAQSALTARRAVASACNHGGDGDKMLLQSPNKCQMQDMSVPISLIHKWQVNYDSCDIQEHSSPTFTDCTGETSWVVSVRGSKAGRLNVLLTLKTPSVLTAQVVSLAVYNERGTKLAETKHLGKTLTKEEPSFTFTDLVNSVNSEQTLTVSCEVKITQGISESAIINVKLPKSAYRLGKVLRDDYRSDVSLSSNGQVFSAHRLMLSVVSPVLETMLQQNSSDEKGVELHVNDIESELLQRVLDFIYEDKLGEDFDVNIAEKLLAIANKYCIEPLGQAVVYRLVNMISVETAPRILVLALQHHSKQLSKVVECFIRAHARQLYQRNAWHVARALGGELVEQLHSTIVKQVEMLDAVKQNKSV